MGTIELNIGRDAEIRSQSAIELADVRARDLRITAGDVIRQQTNTTISARHLGLLLDSTAPNDSDIDLMNANAIDSISIDAVAGDSVAELRDVRIRTVSDTAEITSLFSNASSQPSIAIEDLMLWFENSTLRIPSTNLRIEGDVTLVAGLTDPTGDLRAHFNTTSEIGLFRTPATLDRLLDQLTPTSAVPLSIVDQDGTAIEAGGWATIAAADDITIGDHATDRLVVGGLLTTWSERGSIFVGVPPADFDSLPSDISPSMLGGEVALGSLRLIALASPSLVAIGEDDVILLDGTSHAAGDAWIMASTGIADRTGATLTVGRNLSLGVINDAGERGDVVLGTYTPSIGPLGVDVAQASLSMDHTPFASDTGRVSVSARNAFLTFSGDVNLGGSPAHTTNLIDNFAVWTIDGGIYQDTASTTISAQRGAFHTLVGSDSAGAIVLWKTEFSEFSSVANGTIREADLPSIDRNGDADPEIGRNVFDVLPTQETTEGIANRPFSDTILDLNLPGDPVYSVIVMNRGDGETTLTITDHELAAFDWESGAPFVTRGVGISSATGHVYIENEGSVNFIDRSAAATPSSPVTLVALDRDVHDIHANSEPTEPALFTANTIGGEVTIGQFVDQGESRELAPGSILLQSATGTVSAIRHAIGDQVDVGPLLFVADHTSQSPTFGDPLAGPATSRIVVPYSDQPGTPSSHYLQNLALQVGSPGEQHFVVVVIWHDSAHDLDGADRFATDPAGAQLYPEVIEILGPNAESVTVTSISGTRHRRVAVPLFSAADASGSSFLAIQGANRHGTSDRGTVQVNAQHLIDPLFIQSNPLSTLMPTSIVVYNDPLINLRQSSRFVENETQTLSSDINEARFEYGILDQLRDNPQSEPGFVLAFAATQQYSQAIPVDVGIVMTPPNIVPPARQLHTSQFFLKQRLTEGRQVEQEEIGLIEFWPGR